MFAYIRSMCLYIQFENHPLATNNDYYTLWKFTLQAVVLTIGKILCKHILAKLLTILLEYRLYELYLPEYSALLTFNIIRTKLLFYFCNNKASSCHTYLMQFCQVRQQIPSLESKSRYRREGVTGTGFSRIHVTALVQITKRVVVVVYNIIDIIHLAQQCAFNIFFIQLKRKCDLNIQIPTNIIVHILPFLTKNVIFLFSYLKKLVPLKIHHLIYNSFREYKA